MKRPIEVELTGVCAVACPACPRTVQNDYYNRDMSMQTVDNLLKMFDPQNYKLHLCGCYGDAIYHREFLKIAETLSRREYSVDLVTAAANRPNTFWDQLSEINLKKWSISFSVDGIKSNNHIYRRNARWDSIEYAMQTICNMSIKNKPHYIEWKYLVFPYNKHTVEDARKLSKEIGIHRFLPVVSTRSHDVYYNTMNEQERSQYV